MSQSTPDDDAEGTGADYIRLTSDKSGPSACGAVGTALDFCFGAVGSNCSGVVVFYTFEKCSARWSLLS